MMKRTLIALLIVSIFITSCTTEKKKCLTNKSKHLEMATLWYQKSAEMRALYYQSYNFAKLQLDKKLKTRSSKKLPAIVCDIDETLLNNSPFQGKCVCDSVAFSDSLWQIWTNLAKAEDLPGAIKFAQYAESKGVHVFYVSNRYESELDSTMSNMSKLGFPNIDKEHFLLKTTTSDKEERRNKIRENYEILLFIGDNLGDFENIFDNRKDDLAFKKVDSLKNEFGSKYIILPNPMYGTWEKAIYGGTYAIPTKEKSQRRIDSLVSF